ncbi:hypothetical protein E1A91_A06G223400v1 [Gossypium mustelinum]|uniref:Tyrosinase copper-binding domain-containing protein n=1 Tax=Gossypium mustelinum TaxID=34275 RepID=A0A5D2Z383_GOSMU|nr:hypothetical protein E1A91_A06G223400v1 [Gossypium mustelinum]
MATVSPSITSSFLPKKSKFSVIKNPKSKNLKSIPCKAINGEQEHPQHKFDRRDVLIGLGGLYYGAASLNDAMAAPISAPEMEKCGRADVPQGVPTTDCCPPVSKKILDFKPPFSNSPVRVRPAAHLVDDEYIRKYTKAIELMKALPHDDPRSFMQQANVHCAYCEGAYDQFRNSRHYPPTTVDLDYNGEDEDETKMNKDQVKSNLRIMYRQMVSNAKTPRLFLGGPFRAGDEPYQGSGSIENVPHGPVHVWCGDDKQPNGEDMGTFYSAARDPIFYAHHSNVDRMWSIWKTIENIKRKDLNDPDWLNASFLFYDENANLVRVKVRDCLDHRKLGYDYQFVDLPWLKEKPTPRKLTKKNKAPPPPVPSTEFVLDKPVRVNVERPRKSRSKTEKEEKEEILVIGIELKGDLFVKFDVYVNDEDDAGSNIGSENTEFAGSYVNVPNKHKQGKTLKTCLRLGLTDLLEDLGADDDDSIVVTLVPKYGKGNIKISDIKIEFDN